MSFLVSIFSSYSWLEDVENAQYTDVHYRSLNGEGNFNWRMVFPLMYSKTEDMVIYYNLILSRKNLFRKLKKNVFIKKLFLNIFFFLFLCQMVVVRKRNFYEKQDTQLKIPAQLNVQLWDNDSFSADDFLGLFFVHVVICILYFIDYFCYPLILF